MSEYLVLQDEPAHRQIRDVLSRDWLQGAIERYRPKVREICDSLVGDFVARGGGNFLNEVAYRIPVNVICAILGVPVDESLDWQMLSAEYNLCIEPDCTAEELRRSDVAADAIRSYWRRQAEAHRGSTGDDMLSHLINNGRVDFDTAVAIAEFLFIGGFETTTLTLASGVWTLLQNPSEMKRVRSDTEARQALSDEVLRYCSPVTMVLRSITGPIELADGTGLAAGDSALIVIGAANRDPEAFVDPESFRCIARDKSGVHFGYGIHTCLGNWLAKMEVQETLAAMLDQTASISFVVRLHHSGIGSGCVGQSNCGST